MANATEIVMVIDRSGSMGEAGKQLEAITGFNQFIADQQQQPGEVRVSIYLFNNFYIKITDRVSLRTIIPWTQEDYIPAGMTALLHAVSKAIDETGETLAALPEANRPDLVIFVILTDGLENASPKEYTKALVAEKIKHQSEVYSWQFLYLGNNLDQVTDRAQALDLGIRQENIVTTGATKDAIQQSYSVASLSVRERRAGRKA